MGGAPAAAALTAPRPPLLALTTALCCAGMNLWNTVWQENRAVGAAGRLVGAC